jgi:NAD(P)-dependent dehydrogenase (short-subunit alcohol dehydrogenase family)
VIFVTIDLSSLTSVRSAAQQILSDTTIPTIDVLINNAAIMVCPESKTIDGIEAQFGTNHIGPFLFTNLLVPKLVSGSRVVMVSSSAHRMAEGNEYIDYNWTKAPYHPWRAYGSSKLGNIVFAKSLAKKLAPRGITAYSLCPGCKLTRAHLLLCPFSVMIC